MENNQQAQQQNLVGFARLLELQKNEFRSKSLESRKSIIRKKYDEIQQFRLQQSDGTVHHQKEFRKANRQIDYFQKEFPQLKFPQDTDLNTYDNTKRWLKEFDFPNRKEYLKQLRRNDFKHYKGGPWSYAHGVPDKFEEFKAYHFIEKEESGVDKNRRLKSQQQKYMIPPDYSLKMFSIPNFDRTHVFVPLNPVHQVKYTPLTAFSDQKLGQTQQNFNTIQCKLNEMQKTKPFTSCSTRSEFFAGSYKPLNCEKVKEKRSDPHFLRDDDLI